MIKSLLILALVAVAAVLLYATTRPNELRVQRSVRINAPLPEVHALINDMQRFNTWNPYNKKDPAMKASYRGPTAGPGAAYDFAGNRNIGRGSIAIVEPRGANTVSMQLDMTEPMQARNQIDFRLVPQGNATEVTWAMQAPAPYMAKLAGLFINMDQMIGRDFEAGLAALKALAERR